MEFTFRRRGDTATITLPCSGEQHTVTITLDGTITMTGHDTEAEQVYLALGGDPSPCQRVTDHYQHAMDRDLALRGLTDPPTRGFITTGFFRLLNKWSQDTSCPQCHYRYRNGREGGLADLAHFIDTNHLTAAHNLDPALLGRFTTWIVARTPDPMRLTRDANRHLTRDFRLASRHRGMTTVNAPLLTARYANILRNLFGSDLRGDTIVATRSRSGLRVDWLNDLNDALTTTARRKFLAHHENADTAIGTLSRSRTVPATTVAHYINHGVYSHFHTYNKFRVTPDQVLQVYRAAGGNGEFTLAAALNAGMSISDALREAQRRTSGPRTA